jgi:hypothetical protein
MQLAVLSIVLIGSWVVGTANAGDLMPWDPSLARSLTYKDPIIIKPGATDSVGVVARRFSFTRLCAPPLDPRGRSGRRERRRRSSRPFRTDAGDAL